MKKIVNLTKRILDIVLIFLIAVLALVIVNNQINKDNATRIGDHYIFYVASGSMEPTLEVGDVIISKKTNDYNVGDIVTYSKNNSNITHRIESINDETIITKGDNNKSEDQPISKAQIKCEFYKKSPFLTYFYAFAKDPIMIGIVIFIIICINVLDYLCNDRKDIKDEKENS